MSTPPLETWEALEASEASASLDGVVAESGAGSLVGSVVGSVVGSRMACAIRSQCEGRAAQTEIGWLRRVVPFSALRVVL